MQHFSPCISYCLLEVFLQRPYSCLIFHAIYRWVYVPQFVCYFKGVSNWRWLSNSRRVGCWAWYKMNSEHPLTLPDRRCELYFIMELYIIHFIDCLISISLFLMNYSNGKSYILLKYNFQSLRVHFAKVHLSVIQLLGKSKCTGKLFLSLAIN